VTGATCWKISVYCWWIGGGVAAFKSLDLIRRLRERGAQVTPVLTKAAREFITPLSASALSGFKSV